MTSMEWKASDGATESDVEQKVLYSLITSVVPAGLGYDEHEVFTKPYVRKVLLGKRDNKRYFAPDYVLTVDRVPVVIVEAKKPGEDLVEALREARQYAVEINAHFDPDVNPVRFAIASDGRALLGCRADASAPDIQLNSLDEKHSVAFSQMVSLCNREALARTLPGDALARSGLAKFCALDFAGAPETVEREQTHNQLGSQLAIEYRNVFLPETLKDRQLIARNAYVASGNRKQYSQEIDRIIRYARRSVVKGATHVTDTTRPTEIASALSRGQELINQILLVIGAPGAGKTAFIDHLYEVALPAEIRDTTVWVRLNLNEAAQTQEIREEWILEKIIGQLLASADGEDLAKKEGLLKVFSKEIGDYAAGPLAFIPEDSLEYKVRLSDFVATQVNNPVRYAQALGRYLCGDRNKLLVVSFDNADKRDRIEQLSVFQVARFIQERLKCLTILPLRDITYETYREVPPLDTSRAPLTFQIEPPPFAEVISKRIDLVLSLMDKSGQRGAAYFRLASGAPVEISKEMFSAFLRRMYQSAYGSDDDARNLLIGLAGRSIRAGIDMFLDFCRSGYISGQEALMVASQQGHELSRRTIIDVLVRRDSRYYDPRSSYAANLLYSENGEPASELLLVLGILVFLRTAYGRRGIAQIERYVQAEEVVSQLVAAGFTEKKAYACLEYLVFRGFVYTEGQRVGDYGGREGAVLGDRRERVRISPSGLTLLEFLYEPRYLAACAEAIFVSEKSVAQEVGKRISGEVEGKRSAGA